MKNILYLLFFICSISFGQTITLTDDDIKAFPGAVGHGENSAGGDAGDVYQVTNLNASGTGSLQYGIDNAPAGGRTIIFRVSGWIDHGGNDYLIVNEPNLHIAGQTSPAGIGVRGEIRVQSGTSGAADDLIMRHMNGRNDDGGLGTSGKASLRIVAYNSVALDDVMIDHMSLGWANDENVTITEACTSCVDDGNGINNVTISNTIIDNNINTGYPVIVYLKSRNITFFRNVIAYGSERNPGSTACNTFANGISLGSYEFVNNVVYSTTSGAAYAAQGMDVDFYGNWYERIGTPYSPDDEVFRIYPSSNQFFDQNCVDLGFTTPALSSSSLYLVDNLIKLSTGSTVSGSYNSDADSRNQGSVQVSSNISGIVGASVVKDSVLDNVGAYHGLSQGLNTYDTALIAKVSNDTQGARLSSRVYPTDFPTLSGGTAYPDFDSDGLSDAYEKAQAGASDSTSVAAFTRPATAEIGDGSTIDQSAVTSYSTLGYTHLDIFLADMANDWDNFEVANVPATAITWVDDVQVITDVQALNLSVTFTPSDASDKGVTYSSTNTGVINNSGATVGVGTCTLTVTADDTTNGTLTDTMSVTVNASETPGIQIKASQLFKLRSGGNRIKIKQN